MLAFHSLGENCEFGFAQRHFGAEPIGLLRWCQAPPERLLRILTEGFAGIGSSESTYVNDEGSGEFFLMDVNYVLRLHTFCYADKTTAAETLARHRPVLARMVQVEVDQLIAGDKILVYSVVRPISNAEIRKIKAATRIYSNAPLLIVRNANAANPAGSVHIVDDNLVFGYLPKLWIGQGEIDFEGWLSLCRAAYRLIRSPSIESAIRSHHSLPADGN